MNTPFLLKCGAILGIGFFCWNAASAENFEPISSIPSNTSASDLWPASNLIQGAGVGFEASEPHDNLAGGEFGAWVTDAPGGFPSDYFDVASAPVLTLDFGIDTDLDEVSFWGDSASNANGISEVGLRFATEADGPAGFGTSIALHPTFFLDNDDMARQSFLFSQVTARYVELTAVDNFFVAPGDGSGEGLPGGDRVGLGEVAFRVVDPPFFADGFEDGTTSAWQ